MYQVEDRVVYGIHGVCRVAELEKRVVDRKTVTYLVLEPLGQEGSRYLVPTHNASAMAKVKQMLTRQELEQMLQSQEVQADGWIREENARKQAYRELINGPDRVALMRMVHSLYRHRREQTAAGRKVHLSDENFLRDAEKRLAGEIAVVMEMEPEQARTYLRTQLKSE